MSTIITVQSTFFSFQKKFHDFHIVFIGFPLEDIALIFVIHDLFDFFLVKTYIGKYSILIGCLSVYPHTGFVVFMEKSSLKVVCNIYEYICIWHPLCFIADCTIFDIYVMEVS